MPRKLVVHGLLDDHSRFVPVPEAREAEREVDMLSVFCPALLRNPPPDALYLDNGSCSGSCASRRRPTGGSAGRRGR